ncbi:hypothetical protein ACQP1V_36330 [Microtetraspora malaysiensis]|uniref:hypothetical protein n=1 Tax=Microtetraspora malaysiensis TaxID=161358 RepID=UPI003D8A3129
MVEHFISTPADLIACHRCGQPTLTGWSEGLLARADVTPLDQVAELVALVEGRMTYDFQPIGLPRRPYLIHRHAWRIQATRKWQVVADHRCPPGLHFPPPRKPAMELVIPIGQLIPDNPQF